MDKLISRHVYIVTVEEPADSQPQSNPANVWDGNPRRYGVDSDNLESFIRAAWSRGTWITRIEKWQAPRDGSTRYLLRTWR